jgi:ligand-binding sensor domain-containing protein
MKNLLHLMILISLIVVAVSQSQPTLSASHHTLPFKFDRISVADGLPNQYVNCIVQDKYGFMWFGTKDGLCRYDGQQFKIYKSIPNDSTSLMSSEIQLHRHSSREVHSLPGEEIVDIYEDRSGNMWIATNKGVAKWPRWKKPFRHFTHDTESANRINNAEVTGIDQDENGDLWISTFNSGFCKFNPRTQVFTRYDPSSCWQDTNSAM